MSTHATIAIRNVDGSVESVYCHFDGYTSYVGTCLLEHYNSEDRVRELLKEGHMSSLGIRIDPVGLHSYDDQENGTCVFYGRDRGEEDQEAWRYPSYEEHLIFNNEHFNYLYDLTAEKPGWYVIEHSESTLRLLSDVVTNKMREKFSLKWGLTS